MASVSMGLYLATIGYLLAAINYYLGWLFVTLPIPHRGLKHTGWMMIEDGATYAFLVAAYATIFVIVNFIWQLLYGVGTTPARAYNNLYVFCSWNVTQSAIIIGVLIGIIIAVSITVVGLPAAEALEKAFGMNFGLLGTIISTNMLLAIAGKLIFEYWGLLLGLGALLYGLPARIGRYAGAGLMAFALTFYIGLPLLPSFIFLFYPGYQDRLLGFIDWLKSMVVPDISSWQSFLEWITGVSLVKKVADGIIGFVMAALVMPLAYIAILSMISTGLARTLGGRPFRPPII